MTVVDVKPLVGADTGESVPFDVSVGKTEFADAPAVEGLEASGTVSKLDAGFLVAGTLECARCLKPFTYPVKLEFSEEFALDPGDEQFPAGKDRLKLDPMLRSVILTGLPGRPLHDPACKGLCPVCGKDLNEEPHEHPDAGPGPGPFDQLKKLR